MPEKKIIIAIDGHSSCGKSTLAKDLAKTLSYTYIDTGAMYRAITLKCLQTNVNIDDEAALQSILLQTTISYTQSHDSLQLLLDGQPVDDLIRMPEVAQWVSPVAKIPAVRRFLVDIQRKTGNAFQCVIMDGRDIGTVVFPDAALKLFVTADLDIRARRRYEELMSKGLDITFEDVRKNLEQRDLIDSTREDSPLKIADDAIIIDTTFHTIKSQLEEALSIVKAKLLTA